MGFPQQVNCPSLSRPCLKAGYLLRREATWWSKKWAKKTWLVRLCIGWNPTQLYRDYFINHHKDTYQPTRIQWKVVFFFRGSNDFFHDMERVFPYTFFVWKKHVRFLWDFTHPSGMVVPVKTALFTMVNTDPKCFWLTNFLETLLVQAGVFSTRCQIRRSTSQNDVQRSLLLHRFDMVTRSAKNKRIHQLKKEYVYELYTYVCNYMYMYRM